MAASPRWKIYTRFDEYIGSAKEISLAAAMMTVLGTGATIRNGHTKGSIVFTEGQLNSSGKPIYSGESYDVVAEAVREAIALKRTLATE